MAESTEKRIVAFSNECAQVIGKTFEVPSDCLAVAILVLGLITEGAVEPESLNDFLSELPQKIRLLVGTLCEARSDLEGTEDA